MRIDERGNVWFEKGDRVRPKRVSMVEEVEDPKTGKRARRNVLGPNPRAFGRVEVSEDGGSWVATREPDTVAFVDMGSGTGQVQLASWLAISDQLQGKASLRTRWEGKELYEPADQVQPDAPTSPELPGKKRIKEAA